MPAVQDVGEMVTNEIHSLSLKISIAYSMTKINECYLRWGQDRNGSILKNSHSSPGRSEQISDTTAFKRSTWRLFESRLGRKRK